MGQRVNYRKNGHTTFVEKHAPMYNDEDAPTLNGVL